MILRRENEPDLAELPEPAREQLQFVLADTIDDVLQAAFDEGRSASRVRRAASNERKAARQA